VNGQEKNFLSAQDAMKFGITMVHQELSMVGDMSVAENIFMNRQPVTPVGMIKWNDLYRNTRELIEKFDLNLDPRELVKRLPLGTQQLLEILKAVSNGSQIIILDEPTSSLTEDQIELMFKLIKALKKDGPAIIYITHKLAEIFRIVDRLLVIRDGKYVGEGYVNEFDINKIVTMMVGREINNLYGEDRVNKIISNEVSFSVDNLTAAGLYKNISFEVKTGEILGFAGLIGSGRSEMALGIVGAHKKTAGTIYKNTRKIRINAPNDAIKNKIAYLTEDRKKLGLYLGYSIVQNLACLKLNEFSKKGWIMQSFLVNYANKQIKQYSIRTPSVFQEVNNLSGGNQQKCLFASWMGIDPDVLIIDEPTRGVDVGAKSEIYKIIKEFADTGKSVIVISSELTELLGICDRIIVMRNGKITGSVDKTNWSEETIMHYATGTHGQMENKP
jgi:ABC-type sugar transport system ATPase subunit